MNEKQEKNLIPFQDMDPETRRKICSNGGKASGKARRDKRKLKDLLELAMSAKVTNSKGDSETKKAVAMIKLADKCISGDLKAIELAAKLLGESVDKVEVSGKDGKDIFASLTDEELQDKLAEVRRKLE